MSTPLTIKHSIKDMPFFLMPESQLLNLNQVEFDRMLNEELRIVEDWIKNKRCKCSEHPDIQNKRIVLNCKHIKKVIDNNPVIKEAEDKTSRMTSALIIRNLCGKLTKEQVRGMLK